VSRVTSVLRLLLRILPAVLALALPFLTPDIREGGPFVPVGWVQSEPDRWAGEGLWIQTWASPSDGLPQKGATLPVADLQARKRHTLDCNLFLLGQLSAEGKSFRVVDMRWQDTRRRLSFGLQLYVGLVLLLALPVLLFRPAEGGTLEFRPWTR
jgi:hypothetical protein